MALLLTMGSEKPITIEVDVEVTAELASGEISSTSLIVTIIGNSLVFPNSSVAVTMRSSYSDFVSKSGFASRVSSPVAGSTINSSLSVPLMPNVELGSFAVIV